MLLLIPYVHSIPPDPVFDEYTYGDHGQRARKLKFEVNKGNYVFFHASRGSKNFITAYYVVDRIMNTMQAAQDGEIGRKYKNPHIIKCLESKRPKPNDDDVVMFGDPIKSFILPKPLSFNKQLAGKLSLNIHFPKNKTETQAIGSAARAWRQLTADDVEILLGEIDNLIKNQPTIKSLMSTEEVTQTLEKDIEDYIANHPELFGERLELVDRQIPIETGRIDLL